MTEDWELAILSVGTPRVFYDQCILAATQACNFGHFYEQILERSLIDDDVANCNDIAALDASATRLG